jgi:hypothetical protein
VERHYSNIALSESRQADVRLLENKAEVSTQVDNALKMTSDHGDVQEKRSLPNILTRHQHQHQHQSANGSGASNVKLAVEAFRHVADRFDMLQTIMAKYSIRSQDYMVDVGFLDGHMERTQGVYLYCRKQLDEELSAELELLFHPYQYEVLPFPEILATDDDLCGELMVSLFLWHLKGTMLKIRTSGY